MQPPFNIFTRQIGGVHINRAMVGQSGSEAAPFTPVSAEKQKEAMEVKTSVFTKVQRIKNTLWSVWNFIYETPSEISADS